MQKKCDIYLCEQTSNSRLKFISLFDGSFHYNYEGAYSGYLGVNITRIKLVPVICDLRMNGVICFSSPVEYRDCKNITMDEAFVLAKIRAKSLGSYSVCFATENVTSLPVVWSFNLLYNSGSEEKSNGLVMIDRLDGHVWAGDEYEEYMYDYNNLF